MARIPISLIVDDGIPVKSEYKGSPDHRFRRSVMDGLLRGFSDVCSRHGVKGKFSIIPMQTRTVRFDEGPEIFDRGRYARFLAILKKEITPRFDITPEILTHARAFDMKTGGLGAINEDAWVSQASPEDLADYISLALKILKNAGFPANGLTSPWYTGFDCEKKYAKAIAEAQMRVNRLAFSWYFLHICGKGEGRWPWATYMNTRTGQTVISVPANTDDLFWDIKSGADVAGRVDALLSADGRTGRIAELVQQNCPVTILTHWQSLDSGGRLFGLKAFDRVLRRVSGFFGDRVVWMKFSELAKMHGRGPGPAVKK